MNITEREDTRKYLEDLKRPGDLTLELWSDLVEEAIRTTFPVESPIHNRLKELRTPVSSSSKSDPRRTAYPLYLSAAQVYLGRSQPETRDESLERQVLSIIDAKFLETNIMKIAKWVVIVVIPAIIALVVGKTVYGTFKVEGALDSINQQINDSVQTVNARKEEAVQRIDKLLGDDKKGIPGILYDLQIKGQSAFGKIGTTLGAADEKNTVLGQIEVKKKEALDAITTFQRDGLSELDNMLVSVDKELRKQAPNRIESLAKQTVDIQSRLEGLQINADQILKPLAVLSSPSNRA